MLSLSDVSPITLGLLPQHKPETPPCARDFCTPTTISLGLVIRSAWWTTCIHLTASTCLPIPAMWAKSINIKRKTSELAGISYTIAGIINWSFNFKMNVSLEYDMNTLWKRQNQGVCMLQRCTFLCSLNTGLFNKLNYLQLFCGRQLLLTHSLNCYSFFFSFSIARYFLNSIRHLEKGFKAGQLPERPQNALHLLQASWSPGKLRLPSAE